MKMKTIACLAFLLNTSLFATSYSVSKEALGRIEPIVFTYFVMMGLVPVALVMLVLSRRELTRDVIKSGILLGSCQCLGLFTIYIALKYNTATNTAFFPSLNGFLAALCTWFFLRQRISGPTWMAGFVSILGAALLIFNSPAEGGSLRGALIAFLGSLFCTFYVFLADHEQRGKTAYRAILGVQLLTMALWANLVALLFGDWQAVHPALPGDIWIILYMSLGTICLPTLIIVLMQQYVSPVTVSFIYILEPILGALFARLYLGESLSFYGYLGGLLVIAGAVLHTWKAGIPAAAASPEKGESYLALRIPLSSQQLRSIPIAYIGYPLLGCAAGLFLLIRLGGFPPAAWLTLYRLAPTLFTGGDALQATLLIVQAFSWLLAWSALVVLALLIVWRASNVARQFKLATEPAEIPLDAQQMRALRQMSITPTANVTRANDKPTIQRRRRDRRDRFTRIVPT